MRRTTTLVVPASRALAFSVTAGCFLLLSCSSRETTSTDQTDPAATGQGGAAGGMPVASAGAAGSSVSPIACTPTTCALPVAPSSSAPPSGGAASYQAITAIHLGDATRAGLKSPDAWQDYGFAISGFIYASAKAGASKHCIPVDGANPEDVIVNGKNGVDNSFGKNVVPFLLGIDPDVSSKLQAAIDGGQRTWLVGIESLGGAADSTGLNATFFPVVGAADGSGAPPPVGDWATYVWHPSAGQQSSFGASYLVGQRWVGAPPGDVRVSIPWGALVLELIVHRATLSHRYSADHGSTDGGILSGILGASELLAALKAAPPVSFCTGADVFHVASLAPDIGLDGQQDPSRVCDGISVGLGYESKASLRGDPAPVAPPAEACP